MKRVKLYNIGDNQEKDKNIPKIRKKLQATFPERGTFNTHLEESEPEFNKSESEHVIQQGNSYIVLGRDRDSSFLSGRGGMGYTQASAIDIVVGRENNKPEPIKERYLANPNFFKDAARIYITQRGDVDNYFGLANGSEGNRTSKNQSGIGIKSDHTRIIGRSHVKIVAGIAKLREGQREKNSLGFDIERPGKIDLIAGNYTKPSLGFISKSFRELLGASEVNSLQPAVRGENLVDCLQEMFDEMVAMYSEIIQNTKAIQNLYFSLATHAHKTAPTPKGELIAVPAFQAPVYLTKFGKHFKRQTGLRIQSKNIAFKELEYLSSFGYKYINSSYVNLT